MNPSAAPLTAHGSRLTAQNEFAFVTVLPGPRARDERRRKAARGDKTIETPMYFCEVKPSLLPREAAHDLGLSLTKIHEFIELGKLDVHSISGDCARRGHVRIASASVAEFLNVGRRNGQCVKAFEK